MAVSENAYYVAASPIWLGRVQYAVLKAAVAIANESDQTPHHAERVRLANRVLRGNLPPTVFGWLVLTNATVGTAVGAEEEPTGDSVPDGDIEFVVASVWDALALAYG
jgi:TRAP-type mannitol/chloroaromatic compound transport system permease large subunit